MQIIILAAGKGTRMNSELPKVMHQVAGKPMIEHVINNSMEVTEDLILVYSSHLEPYLSDIVSSTKLVKQEQQLGTAHATQAAKEFFSDQEIAVIYGDNPMISGSIINELFLHLHNTHSKVVTLAFDYHKPNQYGRIITDQEGNFQKIIEEKFATKEDKEITLCNSGIMVFAPGILPKYIDYCVNDVNELGKESYLTDIIEVCKKSGEAVSYYKVQDYNVAIGINTPEELASANNLINYKGET
ncbi:MAG: NTP transferase domain-containing protein [Rickettsiaceae bacterium]|nr:NTP transferase domain-containing protein [Rickettsiaceae bacterium]